jgi:MFS family permease
MGLAYAPLSVTALDRAPRGREGRTTAGLQLTDVLGQALGTGAAGAVVAAGTRGLGDRPGVAVAFGIGALVGLAALVVGARLPDRLVRGAGT